MISFLTYLLLFFVPILLILIVNLRRRQKIVYTHHFLNNFEDKSVKDFLFRTFQLYFDVLFDIIIALLLALFLSGFFTLKIKKGAVCIDASYSMLSGSSGETPLDRALDEIFNNKSLKSNDLFILAFNPAKGRTELLNINRLKKLDTPEDAKKELLNRFTFFNREADQVLKLYRKNYDRVTLITDTPPNRSGKLEILDVGRNERRSFLYPVSAYYDFLDSAFVVILYMHDYKEKPLMVHFNREQDTYNEFPDFRYTYSGKTFSEIRLKQEGLYRLTGPDIDFTFIFKKPLLSAAVEGNYSRIILDVLPQLKEGKGSILLKDMDINAETKSSQLSKQIRNLGKYDKKLITFLPTYEAPHAKTFIQPLDKTLSQPSLTDFPDALFNIRFDPAHITLFYQNPKKIRDIEAPIAYLSELENEFLAPFKTDAITGAVLTRQGISSFVYKRGSQIIPLNLAPEELFPISPDIDLSVQEAEANRFPFFLLLITLYILKMIFLYTYTHR